MTESDGFPVPTDPGLPEQWLLTLTRHGRSISHTTMVGIPDDAEVRSIAVHVWYENPGRRWASQVYATLRSTPEDIASWVAGDGTDAQRIALADGIREGWSHRRAPGAAELERAAELAGERGRDALERYHRAVALGGAVQPDQGRWQRALTQAAEEVVSASPPAFEEARSTRSSRPLRRVEVLEGNVPVRAEDVLGAAARIADLEHQVARAERRAAEEMARAETLRRELAAAVPVVAAARDYAAQVAPARDLFRSVSEFGGGEPYGIERVSARLARWRAQSASLADDVAPVAPRRPGGR